MQERFIGCSYTRISLVLAWDSCMDNGQRFRPMIGIIVGVKKKPTNQREHGKMKEKKLKEKYCFVGLLIVSVSNDGD